MLKYRLKGSVIRWASLWDRCLSHAIQVILVVLFGLDFILLRYVVQHPPMANVINEVWIFDKAKRSLANKEETGTWKLSDAKSLPLS
jgi:hypothetical protein